MAHQPTDTKYLRAGRFCLQALIQALSAQAVLGHGLPSTAAAGACVDLDRYTALARSAGSHLAADTLHSIDSKIKTITASRRPLCEVVAALQALEAGLLSITEAAAAQQAERGAYH